MPYIKREISKEIYDRTKANNNCMSKEDTREVFSISELCGYGVYGERLVEDDGKYYIEFYRGSTCD